MKFLSKIEYITQAQNGDLLVAPGVPRLVRNIPTVRVQDKIQLRTPDGRTINTYVKSLELSSGPKAHECIPILLPNEIAKEDIPIGSEIWHVGQPKP